MLSESTLARVPTHSLARTHTQEPAQVSRQDPLARGLQPPVCKGRGGGGRCASAPPRSVTNSTCSHLLVIFLAAKNYVRF